jgi:hypothetical protein
LSFAQPEKMAYFNLAVGSVTELGKSDCGDFWQGKSVYDVEIDMTNPNPVTNTRM